MKIFAGRLLLIIAYLGIAGVSCSKSEKYAGPPAIEFVKGENLITTDTSASVAENLNFRVHCKSNGNQALTNLIVYSNSKRVYDIGLFAFEFEKDISFAKGVDSVEHLEFRIRDIYSGSSVISLKVTKSDKPIVSNLIWYKNVTLDAQNANGKGFLSLKNGNSYSLQDAFGIQQDINLLYYYDFLNGEGNEIASPGANVDNSVFTGTYGLPNWSTKNTTRFCILTLSQQEFDSITDPAYVVSLYSDIAGKRKAKNLVAGSVYSFKDESTGKYGIIRVSGVTGQDSGTVTFTIVMQK